MSCSYRAEGHPDTGDPVPVSPTRPTTPASCTVLEDRMGTYRVGHNAVLVPGGPVWLALKHGPIPGPGWGSLPASHAVLYTVVSYYV